MFAYVTNGDNCPCSDLRNEMVELDTQRQQLHTQWERLDTAVTAAKTHMEDMDSQLVTLAQEGKNEQRRVTNKGSVRELRTVNSKHTAVRRVVMISFLTHFFIIMTAFFNVQWLICHCVPP